MSGILDIIDSKIVFSPKVYPSNQVKQFGYSWDKNEKFWSAPFSISAYGAVKNIWPDVTLTEALQNKIQETTSVKISDSLKQSSLFDFQQEGSAFLTHHRKALLAFQPGLGKTATSILAAKEVGGVVLIVCPLTLMHTWKNEIETWTGEEATLWHGNKSTWSKPSSRWIVVNYDTVARFFVKYGEKSASPIVNTKMFQVLIVDESILIKNRKAKRTMAIEAISKDIPYTWLLSGAPTSKFYDDLWSQLHILRPNIFKSYWKFAERYCYVERNEWGTHVVGNKPEANESLQFDLQDVMIARTQDQVLDLPEWIIEDLYIKMGDKQYKTYLDMETKFLAHLPESDETVLAPNTLAQLTRLIQLASNPSILGGGNFGCKWDALKDVLEYSQLPVIVWTSYKETAKQIRDMLLKSKYQVAVLTGDTPEDARQPIVTKFQNGEIDILVAHPGVGKFGLTLTVGRTSVYLERSFNGDDYFQSLHRIRRIGTKHSPHVIHLIAITPMGTTTVDTVIHRILKFRKDSATQLTAGLLREFWKG